MTTPINPDLGVNVIAPATPEGAETSRRLEAAAPERASSEDVTAALEGLGKQIAFGGRVAEFSYNTELDRVVVTVYSTDDETREVVRQIPPEEYLAFVARVREFLGVLLDEVS